jgi:hypothetical protein
MYLIYRQILNCSYNFQDIKESNFKFNVDRFFLRFLMNVLCVCVSAVITVHQNFRRPCFNWYWQILGWWIDLHQIWYRYIWNNLHQVCLEWPSSGTSGMTFIRYVWNDLHRVRLEWPSSGTSGMTFIRYLWNDLHQVRLEWPSSGTSGMTFIRYIWNDLHQVPFQTYLMKVIPDVPDEGNSRCTWWKSFQRYLMKVIPEVPDEGHSRGTWYPDLYH